MEQPISALSTPPGSSHMDSVRSLVRAGALHMHWQPIVDMVARRVVGHEALVRTPAGCRWRTPDALFTAAREEGCLLELEHSCLTSALSRRCEMRDLGLLFVNVSAEALVHGALHIDSDILASCTEPRLAGVVLELTEHERVHDLAAVQEALAAWRVAGAALALDDFGDGRSSLRLWSELRPEYVKIDKYFTRSVYEAGHKIKTLRALQQLADTFGSRLIAEGVEEADELMVLRDLGIPFVQGYLLGHPRSEPTHAVSKPALTVLESREIAVLPEDRQMPTRGLTARSLLIEAPYLPTDATLDEVLDLLALRPELNAVALVSDDRPVALIARHTLQELLMHRYFRALYGRRPCMLHANTDPLCVDVHTLIEQLIQVLASPDQRYLRDGFIITENGRYLGLGTGEQLVRRVTEARIEAARHANPLTLLPGNLPLTQHIGRLLENGEAFTACYADLNQFKAFNDHYGYWRGDEMIRLQARCLVDCCDPRLDFIGHVGGDDFVLLMQSADWHDRIIKGVERFNRLARDLYDAEAQQAGGIMAEDRHGVVRLHGLTTVSIGVVRVTPGRYRNAEQVANAAAAAKHLAKREKRGICVLAEEPFADHPDAASLPDSPSAPTAGLSADLPLGGHDTIGTL